MLDYSFAYADLEFFLLVLVRVSCFVFIAPFFSMSNTPRNVRIGVSLCLAVLLYQVVPRRDISYDTLLGYSIIVMKEAVTGLDLPLISAVQWLLLQDRLRIWKWDFPWQACWILQPSKILRLQVFITIIWFCLC